MGPESFPLRARGQDFHAVGLWIRPGEGKGERGSKFPVTFPFFTCAGQAVPGAKGSGC